MGLGVTGSSSPGGHRPCRAVAPNDRPTSDPSGQRPESWPAATSSLSACCSTAADNRCRRERVHHHGPPKLLPGRGVHSGKPVASGGHNRLPAAPGPPRRSAAALPGVPGPGLSPAQRGMAISCHGAGSWPSILIPCFSGSTALMARPRWGWCAQGQQQPLRLPEGRSRAQHSQPGSCPSHGGRRMATLTAAALELAVAGPGPMGWAAPAVAGSGLPELRRPQPASPGPPPVAGARLKLAAHRGSSSSKFRAAQGRGARGRGQGR